MTLRLVRNQGDCQTARVKRDRSKPFGPEHDNSRGEKTSKTRDSQTACGWNTQLLQALNVPYGFRHRYSGLSRSAQP